jgi:glutathione S-transferase
MNYLKALPKDNLKKPLMYSYRRCPYAMRARMILVNENIDFDIFEISLKDKPAELLKISPKGTVPVLVTKNEVIDESLEIISWAFNQNEKSTFHKLTKSEIDFANALIKKNDNEFKSALDHYKYHIRYPEKTKQNWRSDCLFFFDILEKQLSNYRFLIKDKITYADIAIFPFIRQFSNVDLEAFQDLNYDKTKAWLSYLINLDLFKKIMVKP